MPSKVDKVKLTRDQDRRSKVTDDQITEMRKLYDQGFTQCAIAKMFEISQSAVCYIVSEKARKTLREYRQAHPPKRRTPEEARLYARDLRKYKTELMKGEKSSGL